MEQDTLIEDDFKISLGGSPPLKPKKEPNEEKDQSFIASFIIDYIFQFFFCWGLLFNSKYFFDSFPNIFLLALGLACLVSGLYHYNKKLSGIFVIIEFIISVCITGFSLFTRILS